jgi:hypothetical protein
VIAYIRSIKMPDGITPRFLEPTTIGCGPKLAEMVQLITNAQFIAMNASVYGGGSTEIKGTMLKLGLNEPVLLPELGGNTDLDADEDWDWYLSCEEQAAQSRYGGIIIAPREPFDIKMLAATSGSQGINLQLAEQNIVKWITQGRSAAAPGLPQFIFKSQATR